MTSWQRQKPIMKIFLRVCLISIILNSQISKLLLEFEITFSPELALLTTSNQDRVRSPTPQRTNRLSPITVPDIPTVRQQQQQTNGATDTSTGESPKDIRHDKHRLSLSFLKRGQN